MGLEPDLFSQLPGLRSMQDIKWRARYPFCPVCKVELPAEVTRRSRVECLNCGTALQPARSDIYRWVRTIICWFAALTWAWTRGWHDASVVFVIAFYLMPVFATWYYLESYFPPKDFEPVGSYIQTLGIDSHC
jgi:hypothetical protein